MKLVFAFLIAVFGVSFCFADFPDLLKAQHAWMAKDDSAHQSLTRMLAAEQSLDEKQRIVMAAAEVLWLQRKIDDFPEIASDAAENLPVERWSRKQFSAFLNQRIDWVLAHEELLCRVPWRAIKPFLGLDDDMIPADALLYFPTFFDYFCFGILDHYGVDQATRKRVAKAWENSAIWRELPLQYLQATVGFNSEKIELADFEGFEGEAKALGLYLWCNSYRPDRKEEAVYDKLIEAKGCVQSRSLREKIEREIQRLERVECYFFPGLIWAPGHARLFLLSRNVDEVEFDLLAVNEADFLAQFLPRFFVGKPVKSWLFKVENNTRFNDGVVRVDVPEGLPPGLYFLRAAPRGHPEKMQGYAIIIADLDAVALDVSDGRSPATLQFYVARATTGMPVEGAKVTFHRSDTRSKMAEGVTGADGVARLAFSEQEIDEIDIYREGFYCYARIVYGDERILLPSVRLPLSGRAEPSPPDFSWLFDRAVYRPGQVVHYQCVMSDPDEKRVVPNAAGAFTVTMKNGSEDTVLAELPFTTDAHGGFSGSFTLPPNLPPGTLSFAEPKHHWRNRNNSVRVENYRRPTFEVIIDPPGEVRLGCPVALTGRAKMLNGAPLQEAEIRWSVKGGERLRNASWSWPQVYTNGVCRTQADGSFSMHFNPPDTDALGLACEFHVAAVAAGGEAHEAKATLYLPKAAFSLALDAPVWNEAALGQVITVKSESIAGKPVPAWGMLRFHRFSNLSNPYYAFKRFLGRLVEELPDAEPYCEVPFETVSGAAKVEVALPSGRWRCVAVAPDPESGMIISNQVAFRVIEPEKPYAGKDDCIFLAEKESALPGETVRFYWATGLGETSLRVDMIGAEKGLFYSKTYPPATSRCFSVPVTDDLRGGFTVNATMIRNNACYPLSYQVAVPWEREMEVEAVGIPKTISPGQRQVWRVKPARGDARVSAVLYDSALDAVAPMKWPDLNGLFYSGASGANLFYGESSSKVAPSAWQINFFWEWPFFYVQKSGAMAGAVSDRSSGGFYRPTDWQSPPLRSDFRETALFHAFAEPGADGFAEFSFTVPDSLTRWKFLAMAYTDDLSSGTLIKEVESVKPLMVMPNLPRFLREGDFCLIPASLVNTGSAAQRGVIALDVNGAVQAPQAFSLSAGSSTNFVWAFTAPEPGELAFTFTAKGETASDAERRVVPVMSNRVPAIDTAPFTLTNRVQSVTTSLAAHLKSPTFKAGVWRLNLENDPLRAVTDALDAPGGVIANLSSDHLFHVYAASALADYLLVRNPELDSPFLRDPMRRVRAELALAELVKRRGGCSKGWGWFTMDRPSQVITDSILVGFARLFELGITDEKLTNDVDRFLKCVSEHGTPTPACAYARTFFELGKKETAFWVNYVTGALRETWPVQQRRMLEIAATALGIQHDGVERLHATLTRDPIWGASWPREKAWWETWRTPIESHVLGMEMLLLAEDVETARHALQWLLQHKRLNAWETPRATEAAIWMVLKCADFSKENASVSIRDAAGKPLTEKRVEGAAIGENLASITFEKEGEGLAFGGISLSYEEDLPKLKATSDRSALSIEKLIRVKRGNELVNDAIRVGDEVVVRLVVHAAQEMSFVKVTDGRAAGCEPVDARSGWRKGYFLSIEDTATLFYFEVLPRGNTIIDTSYRVFNAGDFQGGSASVESIYAPDFNARTAAGRIKTGENHE